LAVPIRCPRGDTLFDLRYDSDRDVSQRTSERVGDSAKPLPPRGFLLSIGCLGERAARASTSESGAGQVPSSAVSRARRPAQTCSLLRPVSRWRSSRSTKRWPASRRRSAEDRIGRSLGRPGARKLLDHSARQEDRRLRLGGVKRPSLILAEPVAAAEVEGAVRKPGAAEGSPCPMLLPPGGVGVLPGSLTAFLPTRRRSKPAALAGAGGL
jgi:hypothetical protein